MIDAVAIPALVECWQQLEKNQSNYCLAEDSLYEMAEFNPEHRIQVIDVYCNYMRNPDTSERTLNGFLIAQLMDLKAVEVFDEIRHMFALDCVDLSCADDLEEVEIDLGFRTQRSTPKPTFVEMQGYENPLEPFNIEFNDEEGAFFQLVKIAYCVMAVMTPF
jgi:hypothetical protein